MADALGRISTLEAHMEDVRHHLFGNGKPGLIDEAREFFATARANEAHRAKLDAKRAKIHYLLITLLIGLVVTMFGFLLNHYDGKKISFGSPAPGVSSLQKPPQDAAAVQY
jgi:hypothetical protein